MATIKEEAAATLSEMQQQCADAGEGRKLRNDETIARIELDESRRDEHAPVLQRLHQRPLDGKSRSRDPFVRIKDLLQEKIVETREVCSRFATLVLFAKPRRQ